MYWKALILLMIPNMAFACGATDEEIRAMYGFVGFATFAGIALVASVVLAVRALRKPKP
jgi:hypothetical protein